MTENERELIKIFFGNDNPEQLVMAFAVIVDLVSRGVSEAQIFEYLRTSRQTS